MSTEPEPTVVAALTMTASAVVVHADGTTDEEND
jgi:hypothetical protein